MYRSIISSSYSGKSIVFRAAGSAIICAVLFFLFMLVASPAKLVGTIRCISFAALVFGAALFSTLILRFISLRHITTIRFNGTEFLIWAGRKRPTLDALQVLVHLGAALGLAWFASHSSIWGMSLFVGNVVIVLCFERHYRAMRFKRTIRMSEIVSVKSVRGSADSVIATLRSGETVRLTRVPELETAESN